MCRAPGAIRTGTLKGIKRRAADEAGTIGSTRIAGETTGAALQRSTLGNGSVGPAERGTGGQTGTAVVTGSGTERGTRKGERRTAAGMRRRTGTRKRGTRRISIRITGIKRGTAVRITNADVMTNEIF